MATLDELRQQVADAERAAVDAEQRERQQLEQRLDQLRGNGGYQNGVPLPPTNQTAAATTDAERRFMAIQRMNRDNDQRRDIDYGDAVWAHKMAFAELLRSYGNDASFGTENIRWFLRDVEPVRDLRASPRR